MIIIQLLKHIVIYVKEQIIQESVHYINEHHNITNLLISNYHLNYKFFKINSYLMFFIVENTYVFCVKNTYFFVIIYYFYYNFT